MTSTPVSNTQTNSASTTPNETPYTNYNKKNNANNSYNDNNDNYDYGDNSNYRKNNYKNNDYSYGRNRGSRDTGWDKIIAGTIWLLIFINIY